MVKRPWYELTLDRIEQYAHDLIIQTVVMWCEHLKECIITDEERITIVTGLDRIVEELRRPEEIMIKDYVGKIRHEIADRR